MAGSAMCDKNPFVNPNGIASFSPGLARVREGLPWVAAFTFHNPGRVEYQRLMKQIQPLQGCDFSRCSLRVARSSQPWAECFNPVGIEKAMSTLQTSPGIPPKTSRNQKNRVALVRLESPFRNLRFHSTAAPPAADNARNLCSPKPTVSSPGWRPFHCSSPRCWAPRPCR